jgi:hypothetical protein
VLNRGATARKCLLRQPMAVAAAEVEDLQARSALLHLLVMCFFIEASQAALLARLSNEPSRASMLTSRDITSRDVTSRASSISRPCGAIGAGLDVVQRSQGLSIG